MQIFERLWNSFQTLFLSSNHFVLCAVTYSSLLLKPSSDFCLHNSFSKKIHRRTGISMPEWDRGDLIVHTLPSHRAGSAAAFRGEGKGSRLPSMEISLNSSARKKAFYLCFGRKKSKKNDTDLVMAGRQLLKANWVVMQSGCTPPILVALEKGLVGGLCSHRNFAPKCFIFTCGSVQSTSAVFLPLQNIFLSDGAFKWIQS